MTLIRGAVLAALLLLPESARAHAPVEGIGDFYGGLLHPLAVPSHLLTVLGLGLALGQQVQEETGRALGTFGFSLLIGMLLAEVAPLVAVAATGLLAVALLVGILVAAARPLPSPALTLLLLAAGVLLGLDTAADGALVPSDLLLMAGAWLGAMLTVFYVSWLTRWFQQPWTRIGVRVLGSWTAASAVLVLALALFTGTPAGAG